jgi:membrane protease YdiL (CAAX protease family)
MPDAPRVTPTIRNAVLMLLPVVFLLPLLGLVFAIDYNTIADTTGNILRGIVPMVAISLAWGLAVSHWAGWSRPIWSRQPPAMPRVLWLIPICWFAICAARLVTTPWGGFDATYFLVLAVATVMVGFNEELLFRGIIAHGARGTGAWTEARVMLVSAVAFGLFHLPNVLVGQALQPTLIQVAYASVMGVALYAAMRVSGTILLPIAMHALWDFSTFSGKTGQMPSLLSLSVFACLVIITALCVFAVVHALLRVRRPAAA